MDFQTNTTQSSLCISGVVDLQSSPLLLKALQQRDTTLPIDLSGITALDNSGVATFIEALRFAKKRGTPITFSHIPDCVLSAWQLAGVHALFEGVVR